MFGNSKKQANKVYLRRKSQRLSSFTLWAASLGWFLVGGYLFATRDQLNS